MQKVRTARPVDDRPARARSGDVQPQANRVAVVVVDEYVAAKVTAAVRSLAGRLVGDRMPERLKPARRRAVGQADGGAWLGANRAVRLGDAQPAVRERLAVVYVGRIGKIARRAARYGRRGAAVRLPRLRRSRARRQGGVLGQQPVAVPLRQEPGVVGQPLRCIRRGGNHPLEVRRELADRRGAGVGLRLPAAAATAPLPLARFGKGRRGDKGQGKQRGNWQDTWSGGMQRTRRNTAGIKRRGGADHDRDPFPMHSGGTGVCTTAGTAAATTAAGAAAACFGKALVAQRTFAVMLDGRPGRGAPGRADAIEETAAAFAGLFAAIEERYAGGPWPGGRRPARGACPAANRRQKHGTGLWRQGPAGANRQAPPPQSALWPPRAAPGRRLRWRMPVQRAILIAQPLAQVSCQSRDA